MKVFYRCGKKRGFREITNELEVKVGRESGRFGDEGGSIEGRGLSRGVIRG